MVSKVLADLSFQPSVSFNRLSLLPRIQKVLWGASRFLAAALTISAAATVKAQTPASALSIMSAMQGRYGLWETEGQKLTQRDLIRYRTLYGPGMFFFTRTQFVKKSPVDPDRLETLDLSALRSAGYLNFQTVWAHTLDTVHNFKARAAALDYVVPDEATAKSVGVVGVVDYNYNADKSPMMELNLAIKAIVSDSRIDGIALDAEYDASFNTCDIERADFGLPGSDEPTLADCRALQSLYARDSQGRFLKTAAGRYIKVASRLAKLASPPKRVRRLTRAEQVAHLRRYSELAHWAGKPFIATFHPNPSGYTLKPADFARTTDVYMPFVYNRAGSDTYAKGVVSVAQNWKKIFANLKMANPTYPNPPKVYPIFDHGRVANGVSPSEAKAVPAALSAAAIRSFALFIPHVPYYCAQYGPACRTQYLMPAELDKYTEVFSDLNFTQFNALLKSANSLY